MRKAITMQIPGSAERKPILVLGVGNLLLRDDGAGLELLSRLRRHADEWGDAVEFVDGGTGGLTLLGEVSGRRAVVVLDAVRTGAEAGTVHVLRTNDLLTFGRGRASTAHESNATELFRISELLGERAEELVAIGIEPDVIETGIGLSKRVDAAIEEAVDAARLIVDELVGQASRPFQQLCETR
jgi:hydrogenase maturation protease